MKVLGVGLGALAAAGTALALAVGCGADPDSPSRPDRARALADSGGTSSGSADDSDASPGQDASVIVDAGTDADADTGPKPSAGCTSGKGIAEGQSTFQLGGRTRKFVVRLPVGYSKNEPWPVVFALHGNGGTIAEWDATTGIKNIRGELKNDAIVVMTEAIDGKWRDYAAAPATWPARVELELDYFDELVKRLTADLCVDERAIFAMGFSGGGSFAGVLGCQRPYLRAFAAGGAVIYFDPKSCVGTPAAWVTISNGDLVADREAFRDFFRGHAKCGTTSKPTPPSPPCVAYDGCGDATPVHYCGGYDGGHAWPSFGTAAMGSFFRAR